MSTIFRRKKKNETKNQEALDVFRTFNRLAPSSREKYIKTVLEYADFLLAHKKSLWDSDYEDLKKFLLENDTKTTRTVISTFYRVLIDSGEFKRENPVIQLNRVEREEKRQRVKASQPVGRAAKVLQELEDEDDLKQREVLPKTRRRKIPKRIMILTDLEKLIQRASHIRDRAILEFLYATGAQIQEVINLNVSDVDLEARQVTFHMGDERHRTLILPKRTVNFLKIYERWRRRQIPTTQAYFITKTTRNRMSESSISTWLNRVQRDKEDKDRWTAMDFRKRALLQHYWVTRDLTAIARFGGYKRPESALNLISDVLSDQGVDSIDKLASLPEFEALKSEQKKVASVSEADQLTITIQLDQEEMDIIRNSGLTPTQAVKTIISLKDLYGAFSPGGGAGIGRVTPSASASGPSTGPNSGPSLGSSTPASPSGPKMEMPSLGTPSKAPSLGSSAPSGAASGGPSGPSSPSGPTPGGSTPGGGFEMPSLSKASASEEPATKGPSPGGLGGGPSGGPGGPGGPGGAPPPGGGGPMSQLSELKEILAKRKLKSQSEDDSKVPERPGLSATVVESDRKPEPAPIVDEFEDDDEDEDEDEDLADLPDFDF